MRKRGRGREGGEEEGEGKRGARNAEKRIGPVKQWSEMRSDAHTAHRHTHTLSEGERKLPTLFAFN